VGDLSGAASIEIAAPPERCFAVAADVERAGLEDSWRFEPAAGGGTVATYALDIWLNRTLALLRKGVRGPAEARVRALLVDRPLEGLKREAERR
jgi:hypothetical protein